MSKNIERRLQALEAAVDCNRIPYHQAREQAATLLTQVNKIYGDGATFTEAEVHELAEVMAAGRYEEWIKQQIRAMYTQGA